MRAFLEVINGRYAGTTVAVESSEVCTVGARLGADLFLPNDALLAPLHFVVKSEAENCILEKLSGDIFVNNQLLEKGEITHGDFIFAGETLFQFTIDGEETPNETVLGKLIEHLQAVENLYLLIDENLERRVLPILNEREASFQKLKKDAKGCEAMTANPLLVTIGGDRRLLETLAHSFWGKGALVFFTTGKSQTQIVEHWQFLLGKSLTDGGVDARLYDPRILRLVLGEAETTHAHHFFETAEKYFVESQLPSHLLEFGWENENVTANLKRLSPAVPKIPTQAEIAEFLIAEKLPADFPAAADVCLPHFLPDYQVEIRDLAKASLPAIEKYKLKSAAAKIQFVALNTVFGADFGTSEETVELFDSNDSSGDDKLFFLVERLNRSRF